MFNPEMMKMASEMMSKMSPEQLAQMQRQAASMPPEMMQQAMNMAQNATPEQMAAMKQQASSMPPDVLASQAGSAREQLGAQQKYQLDAAMQLKAEGNRLHGSRLFGDAAQKYEKAISALAGHSSQQSVELRTSCQSNLGSCFLQLERWPQCLDMCSTVLAADGANRKALYRRGQALCALGRYEAAVDDLKKAIQLSPPSEKDIIREKLQEAKQKLRQTTQGVVIEEVTEPAIGSAQPAAAAAASSQQEGLAESDTDDDMPGLEEPTPVFGAAAPGAVAAAAMAAGSGGRAGFGQPGSIEAQRRQAADMLKNNPDMALKAAEAMSGMSDEQIASMVAQSGMPGVTPEMARQAAAMMRNMPPEQLSAVAAQAAAAGPAGAGGGFPMPTVAAAPMPSAAAMAAAGGAGSPDQMRAAAEAMRQNPEMMKQAVQMMESMPEEQLQAMASMMPGAPPGMKMDAAQMKMAAKMMSSMSAEDMERMTKMAAGMQGGGMGGGFGGMPSSGVAAGASSSQAALAGAAGSNTAAPAASAAAATMPGGMGGMGGMGMPPGFDPSNMSGDMMADMRKRMQDPEMLKMMKNMLKGMDPDGLASMMKQSGINVSPEQARTMVDKLDGVSDNNLELIARLLGYFNAVVAAYRGAKAWVMSQGALAVAVLVLMVAVLLRWLGWI